MRLTCPNCGAQYEVPDDVIPEEGRDVQCSSCGDTWFQQPAGFVTAPEAAAEELGLDGADEAEHAPQAAANDPQSEVEIASDPLPEPDPEATPTEAPAEVAEQPEPATEEIAPTRVKPSRPASTRSDTDVDEEPQEDLWDSPEEDLTEDEFSKDTPAQETDEAQAPGPQQQRVLDPALSDILREEAEREASLRAADQGVTQVLETQPNLGLDDLPENEEARRSRQAQDRMARIRGEDPRRLAAEASGLKRGVLPDIEEINSTLRAADAPPPPVSDEPAPRPRKSGFTRGFALVILAVLAMVMVYSNAPQIAEILPQADPYLSSYVTWVDQMRLWLDAKVTALQQPQI
ncbi:zinc-ribbon domain-containing protein [Pseudophaeobacter sp.]|uniref:zinc-ribbon domain-containing protein n=1 Tax=Pseudophaeobacter sp. TaxID=1971739 RepID=UPI0032971469